MLKNVSAADLDQFHYDLHCAVEIVGAIHHAEESGSYAPGTFHEALFGAYNYLTYLTEKLVTLYDDGRPGHD